SGSIMIHLGELQYMKGMLRKDTMTEILLAYDEGVDLDDIITWSEGDGFLFKDNVDLYKTEDILSEIFKFIGIIDGFSAIVITVTMIVCLIFTSTLFMISTKQRSLDLAILRAIGFHPFKIVLIVIRESILMYLVGSIIGIIMGLGLNSILNSSIDGSLGGMSSGLQLFKVDERLIAITLFSAFILSLLSALVPAVISAKRSPVRAIRGEL
ncbi:MAG: FtsX-like permease family protein, partial [Candidatus Thermoplasmatota archaeon]|nr:FtsX-like permease family protein [Candidatus Thermoplasmatota archaeon]